MTVPLYDQLQAHKPELGREGNRGLWFERFYDQYGSRNWDILKPDTHHTDIGNSHWLLKHFNNKKVGNSKALAHQSWMQMRLTKSLKGQSHVFKASWHFVTGMGNPHPVENGFAWHPTLGVPYLTGAAVKGLVRTYIENYLDDNNPENPNKKQLLLQWFGSDDKDSRKQECDSRAGELIFFDALPIEPVTLAVDVMTPHMGKWYEKGGKQDSAITSEAVPADWHDPVPVSFLVAKDITLLFSFAIREYPGQRPSSINLDEVANVLQRVLRHEGAGGKTATGYGGMQQASKALDDLHQKIAKAEADKQAQIQQQVERQAKEAALQQMHPIEREIAEFSTTPDAIKALEANQWSEINQKTAAQFLKARMQQEGIWREESKAKNPSKDKDYQRTQVVLKYLL
ncbi:type III-B CRISPR module RAMP protein Cmr6 [Thiofilum flexile]|uniref:type III-B CRISPR module RAMP protein Cmr6 n=1 Tax=Thiofilum flexile TaxID=125627 RepID=UPI0003605E84|nr:type III-B CRISPR module RAMP protein Cmr6 [Thiofilum flexile]